ncbi:MAG TPA: hypothetical protein DD452_05945 [Nitrospina sp.]|nr:hypothetical protein [Nitrospina sp.]
MNITRWTQSTRDILPKKLCLEGVIVFFGEQGVVSAHYQANGFALKLDSVLKNCYKSFSIFQTCS